MKLTQENLEYIGHVYGKELHPMVHDLIDEINRLRKYVDRILFDGHIWVCEKCGKEQAVMGVEIDEISCPDCGNLMRVKAEVQAEAIERLQEALEKIIDYGKDSHESLGCWVAPMRRIAMDAVKGEK